MTARLTKLALVCCSILLGLVLSEVLLRAAVYFELIDYPAPQHNRIIHQYAANRDLVYELKPSAEVRTDGVLIKTNSWGMRDHEYPLEKPPGTFRIAVIGDSVTFGQSLPSFLDTYPKLLETRLNESGRNRYEVMNFSVVGYNSAQEEIVLGEKVLRFKPDMVIVGFCLNDATYTDGLAELAREVAPWSLGSKLHSKLLSYLLFKRERIFFSALEDPEKIKHFFGALAKLSRENHFQPLILIFPYLYENISSYRMKPMHAFVNALAAEHGLPAIDFMDDWKDLKPAERAHIYLPNDEVHLDAFGMKKVADTLAALIVKQSAEK